MLPAAGLPEPQPHVTVTVCRESQLLAWLGRISSEGQQSVCGPCTLLWVTAPVPGPAAQQQRSSSSLRPWVWPSPDPLACTTEAQQILQ
jgi:hypothetical protein